MCRNIRVLYNFEPPATDEEVNAAALQFVRKATKPPSTRRWLTWQRYRAGCLLRW
jgi:hypothetical protein